MIKKLYSLAIAALIGGVIFTSCQTTAEKTDTAEAKVQDAKEELKEARKDESAKSSNC